LGVPMARPDCTARILSGSHVVTPILDPGPALSDMQGLAFLIGRRPVGIQEGSHRPLHDLRALEDVEAADRQREDPGDPVDGVAEARGVAQHIGPEAVRSDPRQEMPARTVVIAHASETTEHRRSGMRWYMKRWPSGPSAVPVCWTNRKKAYTPPTQEVRRTTAASVTSAAFRGGIHVVSECITDNQGADCRLESTWPLAIAAPAPW